MTKCGARRRALMLAGGLTVNLTACGGSSGGELPPTATESAPPTAAPGDEPLLPELTSAAAETTPADPTPIETDAAITTPDMGLGTDAVGTLAAAGTSACLGTDGG